MSIREHLENKPVVGIAVVAVIMLIALIRILTAGGSAPDDGQYYFDLDTGELFVEDTRELPPIEAPSGGEGALAYVFACGSCDNEDDRFIGYIEKYTADGKASIENAPTDSHEPVIMSDGRMLRAADGGPDDWVPENSRYVDRITNVRERCPDGDLARCRP